MASRDMDPALSHQRRMAKKKAVASELLALRRMKMMQKRVHDQRNSNHKYEAYRALDEKDSYNRPSVSRDQVRHLIKGTVLEKELQDVYGEDGIDDVTDHYASMISSNEVSDLKHRTSHTRVRSAPEGRDGDSLQRKLFLHKLMQDRKTKLDEKKQKRFLMEQNLLEEKQKIRIQKSKLREKDLDDNAFTEDDLPTGDSDSSEENLNIFVDKVKQKIGGIERRIRLLKQEQRTEAKAKVKYTSFKPASINYTFKPWQQEQVNLATKIVKEIIDRVLDICVYSEEDADSSMLKALLNADNEQWERMRTQSMKYDAVVSCLSELIDEAMEPLIRKVVEECDFLSKMTDVFSTDLIINAVQATKRGKQPKAKNDATAKLMDQTWMAMVSRRGKSRKDVWSHTQPIASTQVHSTTAVKQKPTAVVEENDGETSLISYEDTPIRSESLTASIWQKYIAEDFKYWETQSVKLESTFTNLPYKRIMGMSCVSPSYDHRHLAVGTFLGDIIVYDTLFQPFRPIRCVSYIGKGHDRIIQLEWSLDGTRLISLSESLCVFVWSVSLPSRRTGTDNRNLSFPDDKTNNYKCQQLTALIMLESKYEDFVLKEGTLATTIDKTAFMNPVAVKFYPSLSTSGSQNQIVVGFSSGDLILCDLAPKLKARFDVLLHMQESDDSTHPGTRGKLLLPGNKIAQGIEIELFRSHRNAIVLIQFINNYGDMITLDTKLNLSLWKRNKDHLTGFNWFTPHKKFKVTGAERVMVQKESEKVVFEDEITLKKTMKRKQRRGKNVIERERQDAEIELRTLKVQNRQPWHSDDQDIDDPEKKKKPGKFITKIYAPRKEEVLDPLGDQIFHKVTKQTSTNMLVKYATQVYEVSSATYTSLVHLQVSQDGDKIYFMFLHDRHPPNIKRHLTFVDLNLNTMDMVQSCLIKLEMTKEQYSKCIANKEAAFAVTRTYLSRGDYVFCSYNGRLHVFSLKTGAKVAWCPADKRSGKKTTPPAHGLQLPAKLGHMIGKMKLVAVCPNGDKTYLVLQTLVQDSRVETVSGLLMLSDESLKEQKEEFSKINKALVGAVGEPLLGESFDNLYIPAEETISLEQCVQTDEYTSRHMPTVLYVRMTLNSIIDNAVAVATGERMTKEQRKKLWQNDWKKMQAYFQQNGTQTS